TRWRPRAITVRPAAPLRHTCFYCFERRHRGAPEGRAILHARTQQRPTRPEPRRTPPLHHVREALRFGSERLQRGVGPLSRIGTPNVTPARISLTERPLVNASRTAKSTATFSRTCQMRPTRPETVSN